MEEKRMTAIFIAGISRLERFGNKRIIVNVISTRESNRRISVKVYIAYFIFKEYLKILKIYHIYIFFE